MFTGGLLVVGFRAATTRGLFVVVTFVTLGGGCRDEVATGCGTAALTGGSDDGFGAGSPLAARSRLVSALTCWPDSRRLLRSP